MTAIITKTCHDCDRSKCILTRGVYRAQYTPDYCAMDPGERVYSPSNAICNKFVARVATTRHCLKCGRPFRSRHGLRTCDACKTHQTESDDSGHSLSEFLSRADQHHGGRNETGM
jgi:hypothetical protein